MQQGFAPTRHQTGNVGQGVNHAGSKDQAAGLKAAAIFQRYLETVAVFVPGSGGIRFQSGRGFAMPCAMLTVG